MFFSNYELLVNNAMTINTIRIHPKHERQLCPTGMKHLAP